MSQAPKAILPSSKVFAMDAYVDRLAHIEIGKTFPLVFTVPPSFAGRFSLRFHHQHFRPRFAAGYSVNDVHMSFSFLIVLGITGVDRTGRQEGLHFFRCKT